MAPAMIQPDDDAALRQAYADADHEQRIRLSRIGCVLAVVMVPLFWGLDWVVYPSHVYEFGLARLLCDVGIMAIWALLATALGRRWIRFLGIAWALCPGVAISWMIYASEGADSPYYAGLNLVLIIVSLLMPWTAIEVVALCVITIGLFILACVLHAAGGHLSWPALMTSLYFMGSTAVICVTAGVLSGRRRWTDFRLRHELDRRNHELRELDRLKGEFYANVSHELRTPLTLILAPLQRMLASTGFERGVVRDIGLMHGNALRLLRLINDILEVVRLDGGRLELRRNRLDLAMWVPGVAQSARHLAESKGLDFSCDGPPGPLPVDADPSRLDKVLLNLLSNAMKFTHRGGKVVVRWGDGENGPWFEVQDSGIGIPAAELPRLFQRFHQVDNSATRQFRGLGLGLSLSRDLVERHGGRMQVESEFGRGSRFRVELPRILSAIPDSTLPMAKSDEESDVIVRAYHEADRQVLATEEEHGLPLETILEPERPNAMSDLVLIADDEPDMRRFLASLLRSRYRVMLASDSARAVALAQAHRPSLVLLDMMMPPFDGMEACRRIRSDSHACECRIILLTARADDETRLGALQGGADDFLTKPFSSEEVLSRAHNLLENAALQRSLRERNRDLEQALTRLRSAEAQLVQSEKMNAIGNLAAGLLHEINNPLNYAQMAVHIARENVPTGDTVLTEMLKDASEGMTRIGSVISSLRSFAYPDHADLKQSFLVNEAVDLALRFTALQCEGVVVKRQTEPGLHACGSVNQMSMVLVNLVTNASRALREAGEISIIAEQRAGCARIEVKDNGIGMDEEHARRAFDPFYTTSEPGQGMGLGLSICHTIVRNHRGSIGISSQPQAGTTVWIELPSSAAVAATESAHG